MEDVGNGIYAHTYVDYFVKSLRWNVGTLKIGNFAALYYINYLFQTAIYPYRSHLLQ
jgi:hypothetical protein